LLEDHVLIIYIFYTIYKCLVALHSEKFKFFQVSSLPFFSVGKECQAVHQAREERASDTIQKVEHPLRADYEYTLRRVDHRHPRRPTNFTRGENHSIINRYENPYDWTTELHDQWFCNNFQGDGYLTVIKDGKNPISSHMYVDWPYMQRKHDPMFQKVITMAQSLGIYDRLGLHQEWNTKLVA
jgi:hypothetical protein